MDKYILKVYITGQTSKSERAINNIKKICEGELEGQFKIEVIDILEDPKLAEDEKILATPTLVKTLPSPIRRIIGDLSDMEKVLIGLNLVGISTR